MNSKLEECFVKPREQESNFGFAIWRCQPRKMERFHHHNDIELNFVVSGTLTYLYAGEIVRLQPGDIGIFWAARPHQVVERDDDTWFYGISIPLAWFQNWHLPNHFSQHLFQERFLVPQAPTMRDKLAAQLDLWIEDLDEDTKERRRVLLLEIEAWFHRLVLHTGEKDLIEGAADDDSGRDQEGSLDKVEEIARFVCENYVEPLSVTEIAEEVNLHPNYAVQLFKKKTGITIVEFIAQQRLAHAQLLLATSDSKVLDIALQAGFGSGSRFYAIFKEAYNMSPREYRAMLKRARKRT